MRVCVRIFWSLAISLAALALLWFLWDFIKPYVSFLFYPALFFTSLVIMSARSQAQGLALQVKSDAFPSNLQGDTTRLQQVVLNYVSNAVKFTQAGCVTLRALRLEETDQAVRIRFEVKDAGIGIKPEALPRLFSAFKQADNSTTR